jgi:protein-disulfide isomerase
MRLFQLTLAALAALAAACGHPAQKPSDPVAKFGGEVITAGDLDQQVGGQVYELKKQALDQLVRDRLIQAKAKKEGSDVETYLKKAVPEPTVAEAQQLYDQTKVSRPDLPAFDAVKDQIFQYLKQQKTQAFLEGLRKEADVKILLPPYRVPVEAQGPAKGKDGAPITIVEFSDFQCPFCVKAEPTVAELLKAYPDKIRLVFRDYPLPFHQLAPKAAEASHCAEDQGKFWDMHGKMFGAGGKLEVDNLKKMAREVGLDGDKFDKCLDSGEKAKAVAANFEAGKKAGVTGTPAFFVNGRLLSGALPIEEFKKIVDEELAAK